MSAKTLQLSDQADSVKLIYYILRLTVGGEIRVGAIFCARDNHNKLILIEETNK